ncbi:hypothetical protein Pmar_PMAR010018 [Perkinsus marinus ATCC 50983]|uniref:Uncharacterized protein n=1 Tax=Perkinsus marinus (strain ATCC 50983 / TXsc) TaxID=423536 RepID=C5K5J5_PERM5|nr:hypothetical protein Pmar_PMAR010018 [Perkinsus marinus ATCC 50983]EER20257.1 hypothetical protein Pmar_PMAR010018 [Perkinsus marinus ATCC 50983]|eukprot:XP_002788461.1 hypothetical protein Pmar_PMAR010018 [Perkinsus marinus ATCC 50983]
MRNPTDCEEEETVALMQQREDLHNGFRETSSLSRKTTTGPSSLSKTLPRSCNRVSEIDKKIEAIADSCEPTLCSPRTDRFRGASSSSASATAASLSDLPPELRWPVVGEQPAVLELYKDLTWMRSDSPSKPAVVVVATPPPSSCVGDRRCSTGVVVRGADGDRGSPAMMMLSDADERDEDSGRKPYSVCQFDMQMCGVICRD